MQTALLILVRIETRLSEIKKALGERWPTFAEQIRIQVDSLTNLKDEVAQDEAANQLLGFLIADETIEEILFPEEDREPDPDFAPKDLETVANRIYVLCSEADKATEQTSPDPKTESENEKTDNE